MYPFFESIKVDQGILWNLDLHLARMKRTISVHYGQQLHEAPILQALSPLPIEGKYKLKLQYDDHRIKVEINPYHSKVIHRFIVVEQNDIEYAYKYSDRSPLQSLMASLKATEEIIIIKNDLVTDTSYSNLAFQRNGEWFTPSTPLLQGIKRTHLISKGLLRETRISIEDLSSFSTVCLINAMLDIDELSLSTDQIVGKIKRIN